MEINQPTPPTQPLPLVTESIHMEPSSKHFSLRTLFLILGLATLTIFFLILALMPPKQEKITRIQPTPTPNPAQSVLALTETIPTGTQAASLTTRAFAITIQTGTNKVTAVQVTLAFDPKSVTMITLTPGDFFNQPVELIKTVDYTDGRIVYALGINPNGHGLTGQGTIATITYHLLPTASSPLTFHFLPKTIITAEGITPSVLKQAKDLTLTLPTTMPQQTLPVGTSSSSLSK